MHTDTVLDERVGFVLIPPVRICYENKHGLVTLLDMLRFYASSFVAAFSTIGQAMMELRMEKTMPSDHTIGAIGSSMGMLQKQCEALGLDLSVAHLKRMAKSDDRRLSSLLQGLEEAQQRIWDELNSRVYVQIGFDRSKYYEPEGPPFGQLVADNFPSASFDIVEACKCHALQRSTACVFHLMRVLEIGLKGFAGRFAISADHTNWHNIIEGIEKSVRNIGSDPSRTSDWKEQQEFFSQAASHFMTFKDAWRNYTAHARGKYTDEEAEVIMINVRMFMQKLATQLHE